MKIDLHLHTTTSDGRLSPAELIQLLKKKKIKVFSVTDHDTVAALPQVRRLAPELDLEWIPGIEISCSYESEEVHLLAYHIRYQTPCFRTFLSQQHERRKKRFKTMIEQLNASKVAIQMRDVEPYLHSKTTSPGRPHLAQALVRLGYAATLNDAFRLYLIPGKPGFVPSQRTEATEAIQKILENGGVPVLAHPGLLKNIDLVSGLIQAGLAGIEAYHPSHRKSQRDYWLQVAQRHDLIVTGGSDFHGGKEDRSYLGSCGAPAEAPERLVQAARQIRKNIRFKA